MEDWREKTIAEAIKRRIEMYQATMDADEIDVQWAKDNQMPELESWFTGRIKGHASAQTSLRDILKLFPGEEDQ